MRAVFGTETRRTSPWTCIPSASSRSARKEPSWPVIPVISAVRAMGPSSPGPPWGHARRYGASMSSPSIMPAILCGGSGSRLWPLSRRDRPKQLLDLDGTGTLLERTLARCRPFAAPLLIGSESHVFPMSEALRGAGRPVNILAEPCGRDTAAAAAAVALEAVENDVDLVLLLPADQAVGDPQAFVRAVEAGVGAALEGHIVVFGIEPDHPATRYGYIRPASGQGVRPVARFVEKPDHDTAVRFIAEGCLWNAGMFLFKPGALLEAFSTHAPVILEGVRLARSEGGRRGGIRRFGPSWSGIPGAPLDRAVMERTDAAAVVPVRMGWTDLGTYDALYELAAGPEGNAVVGDVVTHDVRGSYLHADGVLLAAQDIEDLVIVATPDATLVAPRRSASDLKRLIAALDGRRELAEHRSSHRPWGRYEVLADQPGFRVKTLTVAPEESLSLQRHQRRREHWIVVSGRGTVELDGVAHEVGVGDDVRIEAGVAHRLSNGGHEPLTIIEVQLGDYLSEDDIERLEDRYGRT